MSSSQSASPEAAKSDGSPVIDDHKDERYTYNHEELVKYQQADQSLKRSTDLPSIQDFSFERVSLFHQVN